jgi:hypothetical protein
MGQEAQCTARFKGESSEGKALLESDHLLFRGSFRLKIPFKDLKGVSAEGGALTLQFADGPAVLNLGPLADKWAKKILTPPTLMEKLGVKQQSRVALDGDFDEPFKAELRERSIFESAEGSCDLFFFACSAKSELKRIRTLARKLKPTGGLWVVYPKGLKEFTEMDVLLGGRDAGLKDTKVASFSATHTALRFVLPVSKR